MKKAGVWQHIKDFLIGPEPLPRKRIKKPRKKSPKKLIRVKVPPKKNAYEKDLLSPQAQPQAMKKALVVVESPLGKQQEAPQLPSLPSEPSAKVSSIKQSDVESPIFPPASQREKIPNKDGEKVHDQEREKAKTKFLEANILHEEEIKLLISEEILRHWLEMGEKAEDFEDNFNESIRAVSKDYGCDFFAPLIEEIHSMGHIHPSSYTAQEVLDTILDEMG